MTIPKRVRDKVVEREDHCCILCGKWAEGGSLHHRKLRSQGGQNIVENLVLVCGSGSTKCHAWAHENRTEAGAVGLIVPAWEDPAVCPVSVHGYGWVLLTADGRYAPATAPLDPSEVAA